jgi:hypothetical protein
MNDMRDQIAEAIGRTMILRTSLPEITDAVMAVVQPELDRLNSERDEYQRANTRFQGINTTRYEAAIRANDRAEEAEAAIACIRRYAGELNDIGYLDGYTGYAIAEEIYYALDGMTDGKTESGS